MAEKIIYNQWVKRGDNMYFPSDNSSTKARVEAGLYDIRYVENIGAYLFKKNVILDELIDLPMPEAKEMMEGITKFWERKNKFIEYKYAYKRGILLYGLPGGGKTSIINLVAKKLIDTMDGVLFTITSDSDLGLYRSFMSEIYRVIEKGRPVITIIEDIDGLCNGTSTETSLINMLDGIDQMEDVVYIATTNYTERLPARILNRPNRFDLRIEIKTPNEECRELYFRKKLKPHDLEVININEWINSTEGLTLAHLGELIKSVIIMGNGFESTLSYLRELKEIPVSSNYDGAKQSIGFAFTNYSMGKDSLRK